MPYATKMFMQSTVYTGMYDKSVCLHFPYSGFAPQQRSGYTDRQ